MVVFILSVFILGQKLFVELHLLIVLSLFQELLLAGLLLDAEEVSIAELVKKILTFGIQRPLRLHMSRMLTCFGNVDLFEGLIVDHLSVQSLPVIRSNCEESSLPVARRG